MEVTHHGIVHGGHGGHDDDDGHSLGTVHDGRPDTHQVLYGQLTSVMMMTMMMTEYCKAYHAQ